MAADAVDDRSLAAVRGQVQLRSCRAQLPGVSASNSRRVVGRRKTVAEISRAELAEIKSGGANAAREVQIVLSVRVSKQLSEQASYAEAIAFIMCPPYGFIDYPPTSWVWPVYWHFL